MDETQFREAEELFHQVLAMGDDERSAFLAEAAHRDPELAHTVARMVRFAVNDSLPDVHANAPIAGAALGVSVDDSSNGNGLKKSSDQRASNTWLLTPFSMPNELSADGLIGSNVGPYRLTRLLGEGGFGSVYLAEQSSPVKRNVALKMLRDVSDSHRVIARFEAERQAMATLDHPNIAKIFDAGQTDPHLGSRPFVVMEYISGESVTEYCQSHALNINVRLEMFINICQAVQHAHQKGIIHRDLKPSNVLVRDIDGAPAVTIIDFGIAKAISTDHPLTDHTFNTQRLELLGTPQYMSPEQADPDGRGVDTRTDIYSLGAVLYELLTGTTPIDSRTLTSASYARMLEIIRTHTAERPSTRVKQLLGDSSDPKSPMSSRHELIVLQRRLKGDLDWIVMKALEPERERRYSSAAALENDVRRHLNHQPVEARPPSTVYLLRKYVRRHRGSVIAAAIILLTLIGGVIGTINGLLKARDSAEQSVKVNAFMREVLTSVDPDRGKGLDVRLAEVLESASETASERFAGHPELEAELRELLGTVYSKLSLWPEAVTEFKRLHQLWMEMSGPDDPRTLRAQLIYVRALGNFSRIRDTQRVLDDLIPRVDRVLGPDNYLTIQAHVALGNNLIHQGEIDRAEPIIRDAYAQGIRVGVEEHISLQLLDALVRMLQHQLRLATADSREPIRAELEQRATELLEQVGRKFGIDSVHTIRARFGLARAVAVRGDLDSARDMAQQVLDAAGPRLGDCHDLQIEAGGLLASILYRQGDAAHAADLMLKNVTCQRTIGNPMILLGQIHDSFSFLDQGHRWDQGEALARELHDALVAYGGGHGAMLFSTDLHLARFVSLKGRLPEAQEMFETLLARESEAQDEPVVRARLHALYGAHMVQRGQFDAAEAQLQTAVQILGDDHGGTWDVAPDDVVLEFIGLYKAWGKDDKRAEYEQRRQQILIRAPMAV